MPNIKSAKKRVRVTETKTLQNKMFKTQMKTDVKKYRAAVAANDMAAAQELYKVACKKIDVAAAKGIIHKNQAANRKSGVMQLANTIVTDADRAAYVKPEPKKQEATGNKKAAKKA